jgi:hypothetical protein
MREGFYQQLKSHARHEAVETSGATQRANVCWSQYYDGMNSEEGRKNWN